MSFSYVNPKFVAIYLIATLPIALVSIFLLWIGEIIPGLIFGAISIACIYIIIRLLILRKIIITDEGITHKTSSSEKSMQWSEVKSIGVSKVRDSAGYRWMYFTSHEVPHMEYVDASMVCDTFFIVSYRPSIVNLVKTYWNSEIEGVD